MTEKFTTAKEFDGFLKVNSCGKQLLKGFLDVGGVTLGDDIPLEGSGGA